MSELQEITTGKNLKQLFEGLKFQLKNGETLGGTICSHFVFEIEKLKGKVLTNKQYNKIHTDYRGIWKNPQYPKFEGRKTAILAVGELWIENEHFIILK